MTDACRHTRLKAALGPLRRALRDAEAPGVRRALAAALAPDAVVRLSHPFGTLDGPEGFWHGALAPLLAAVPDLERREHILIAGPDHDGADWVGAGGVYTGSFRAPLLGIPPTGHQMAMRYHEFFRFDGDRVVEVQALWDLPEVMMQAGAWPMAPSLGREWNVPGPATGDGLVRGPRDPDRSEAARAHVVEMLDHMQRHPARGGPEVMEMARFWHPRMSWYGPAGIGTGRGIEGFRRVHQIPFLAAMPDRGRHVDQISHHFMADGDYVGVTGWPNMLQTISADGWLGIAPSGQRVTMRSLDFWHLEDGLIRENWVLVDLLDVWRQLGVDVLARMRALTRDARRLDA